MVRQWGRKRTIDEQKGSTQNNWTRCESAPEQSGHGCFSCKVEKIEVALLIQLNFMKNATNSLILIYSHNLFYSEY